VSVQTRGTLFRLSGLLIILAGMGAIAAWITHSRQTAPTQKAAAAAQPVIVATAQRRDVAMTVDGLGTIQAFNRVVVKPRVTGQIIDLTFTEGQKVEVGDVIAHIDPKPFAATLKQAQSSKEKDDAQLANTRLDLKRTADLAQMGYSADQALDTQRAAVASQEATVDADEAAIEAAQVQLDYTTVRSPISGITGIRMIDAGNVIQPTDPGIVNVAQLEPINLVFALPASAVQTLPVGQPGRDIPVDILSADRSTAVETGNLSLVDNAIDPATSMVKLKATFSNKDHALKPGQFVTTRLRLSTQHNVVTIPPTALQRDQNGAYVFVVDETSHVKHQPVTVEETSGKDEVIVTAGLNGGESVVQDGQYGLSDGAQVAVSNAAPGPVAERTSGLVGMP